MAEWMTIIWFKFSVNSGTRGKPSRSSSFNWNAGLFLEQSINTQLMNRPSGIALLIRNVPAKWIEHPLYGRYHPNMQNIDCNEASKTLQPLQTLKSTRGKEISILSERIYRVGLWWWFRFRQSHNGKHYLRQISKSSFFWRLTFQTRSGMLEGIKSNLRANNVPLTCLTVLKHIR